ncbi:MAG: hypothetical protein ACTSO9_15725 [Candidatus Helarchaeota archaeon]
MSFLDKFDDWPSPEKTKILLIFGLISSIAIYAVFGLLFLQTGGMANQLSFSGPVMKSEYLQIILNNGIDAYRILQILDYLFMVGYGTLIFSMALLIARKFDPGTHWRSSGYIFAILGIIAACFDAVENAFILLTLTNPLFFPDWWAVAHSICALPKWIIIISSIIWALTAAIVNKVKT